MMICNQVFVNSFMYELSVVSIMSLCSASHVPVGRPGLASNATSCERLVVVGLPIAAQTPPRCGQALLGQAPKQEGAAHYNRPLAGHGLGARPGWPQAPFQTHPLCAKTTPRPNTPLVCKDHPAARLLKMSESIGFPLSLSRAVLKWIAFINVLRR
jgi:hypothetical protein